jgi:hypothetical protein
VDSVFDIVDVDVDVDFVDFVDCISEPDLFRERLFDFVSELDDDLIFRASSIGSKSKPAILMKVI